MDAHTSDDDRQEGGTSAAAPPPEGDGGPDTAPAPAPNGREEEGEGGGNGEEMLDAAVASFLATGSFRDTTAHGGEAKEIEAKSPPPAAAVPEPEPAPAQAAEPASVKPPIAFAFPGDGIPRESTRLTKTGRPCCAYADCPKQSQGRRYNFMCASHFRSIAGGRMITPTSSKASSSKTTSKSKATGKSETGTSSSKSCYDPTKVVPADDIGKGWTVRIVPRSNPGSKAVDRYWFSPVQHHRFRSRVEIERYMAALQEVEDGDEDEAWKIFQGGGTNSASKDGGNYDDDGASSSSSDEDDADWKCDHCGVTVSGTVSRCPAPCYRWKGGVHPMMKKKFRRQRELARSGRESDEPLDGGYWDTGKGGDGNDGGGGAKVPGATTTRSGRKSGRRTTLADEQAKASEAPTRKRQRSAAKGNAVTPKKEAADGGKNGSTTKARKKAVKTSAKARRDARKREVANEEAEAAAEEEGVSDSFHATMLRAVNEAPNAYAQALAAAAFDAAGGDAWLREQTAKQAMATNANLRALGLAPLPPVKILPPREDPVRDVLEEMVLTVEARAAVLSGNAYAVTPVAENTKAATETLSVVKAELEMVSDQSALHVEAKEAQPEPPLEDPHWDWEESKQMNHREVQRISVKDPNARQLVNDARISGIPVVLTDHVGWAGFASRWLRRKNSAADAGATVTEEEKKSDGEDVEMGLADDAEEVIDGSSLDLSNPELYLDVEAMAADIGDQEVPIIKKSYDDTDPIAGKIPLHLFLQESWPSPSQQEMRQRHNQTLYLHQWQFPLNEVMVPKLCHQSKPLPNSIFGEDLHKYWLDRVPNDCPLQYLFMGNEETMSKMHKDPGGLAITIAPIVGEKECVLVHRDDGNTCLYHLEASVDPDSIDLDAYPLLANARIWRTVVTPGEILLMPQGTYHQCRNVKPCLSYSRFHLDEVNLPAFLQSLFDGDATELLHDEVLWNAVEALMKKVDKVTDAGQDLMKRATRLGGTLQIGPADMKVGEDISKAIHALRSLRHIAREVARKLDLRESVKGTSDAMPGPSSGASRIDGGKETWFAMVEDIDYCLHEFRYRFGKEIPPIAFIRPKGKKRFALPSTLMRSRRDDSTNVTIYNGYQRVENNEDGSPILAFSTDLERGYILLSKAPPPMDENERQELNVKISHLALGDTIMVKMKNKMCDAVIMEIRTQQNAAFISYESYPGLYDEWLPSDLLRDVSGGKAEVPLDDLRKPGKVVIGLVGDKREEYRGMVKSFNCGLLVRAKLNFRAGIHVERWIDSESILGVGGIKRGTRKRKASSSDEEDGSDTDSSDSVDSHTKKAIAGLREEAYSLLDS